MNDLRVFNNPGSYYLFGDDFMPGAELETRSVLEIIGLECCVRS